MFSPDMNKADHDRKQPECDLQPRDFHSEFVNASSPKAVADNITITRDVNQNLAMRRLSRLKSFANSQLYVTIKGSELMKKTVFVASLAVLATATLCVIVQAQTAAHWPQWRGPFFNGMARGDAPVTWSDTSNIKWKTQIPGRGHSTPAIWGDRIFVTTAIATGKAAPTPSPTEEAGGERRRGAGGGAGPLVEHNFDVLALDRKTGKILWQRTAKVATPHEGYHRAYGSFASNSPATDGRYVYASFGSRGIYCYDINGKLIWEKDLNVQMKMRLAFGEGAAPLIAGDRLFLVFDHEAGSFMVALDKRNGKELWRATREEPSSWSTPLAIEHDGRTQIVVSATNNTMAA